MTHRLAGFSMVEALVAFAILIGGVTLFAQHLPFFAERTGNRVDAALAADFARSRLDAFGVLNRAEPGVQSGAVGDRWIWRETAQAVRIGQNASQPFLVTIEVFNATGQTRIAVVEGYRR